MELKSKLHHLVRTTPWLGRVALRIIPDRNMCITVKPVGKFAIRLRRDRGYWLRSPLSNDGFMLGALQRMVHPGDVVYDVGANIGLYSRIMVQQFQASRIYAFEPVSENRSLLMRNLEIGYCADRVVVLPFAIGNEDGSAEFQVDDISSHSGTLDAVTHGAASASRQQYHLAPLRATVQVCRLDSLIRDRNLTPPQVLKLDIEGAEAMALRGAIGLLREHSPNLVIELHGAKVAAEVLQILWECGYHCFGYLESSEGCVYKKLQASDLSKITDLYSLHFLAACVREEELTLPIVDPEWC